MASLKGSSNHSRWTDVSESEGCSIQHFYGVVSGWPEWCRTSPGARPGHVRQASACRAPICNIGPPLAPCRTVLLDALVTLHAAARLARISTTPEEPSSATNLLSIDGFFVTHSAKKKKLETQSV
jgi:hypothetical protein